MSSVLQVLDVEYNAGAWRQVAECRSVDPDVFFPMAPLANNPEQVESAKKLCAMCAVSDECLEYAMASNQDCGIWGGYTEEERRALRRERRVTA